MSCTRPSTCFPTTCLEDKHPFSANDECPTERVPMTIVITNNRRESHSKRKNERVSATETTHNNHNWASASRRVYKTQNTHTIYSSRDSHQGFAGTNTGPWVQESVRLIEQTQTNPPRNKTGINMSSRYSSSWRTSSVPIMCGWTPSL